MILLVLGNLMVWTAGMSLGLVWDWQDAIRSGDEPATAWELMVVPPLAAWLVAELINLATPRRLFDRRAGSPVRRALVGAAAGAVGFVLAVLMLPLMDATTPDWLTLAAASGLGTVVPVAVLARVRRGHCVHCGYDLTTLPSMHQCPECGRTGVL